MVPARTRISGPGMSARPPVSAKAGIGVPCAPSPSGCHMATRASRRRTSVPFRIWPAGRRLSFGTTRSGAGDTPRAPSNTPTQRRATALISRVTQSLSRVQVDNRGDDDVPGDEEESGLLPQASLEHRILPFESGIDPLGFLIEPGIDAGDSDFHLMPQ